MSESYEYKLFDDRLKRNYLLSQIYQLEVRFYELNLDPSDERHPDYAEWKYEVDNTKAALMDLRKKYEDLGGTFDVQEIRSAFNNTQ